MSEGAYGSRFHGIYLSVRTLVGCSTMAGGAVVGLNFGFDMAPLGRFGWLYFFLRSCALQRGRRRGDREINFGVFFGR